MSIVVVILISTIVGSVCLIYGVSMMSNGLESINMTHIKKVLERFTSSVFSSLVTGTVITAVVQSSTAITIITVGLVNTGVLKFSQALGIIYGANIGTTITAQFMSFNISDFYPAFISLGAAIWLMGRRYSVKSIGKALIGFGLMLLGMNMLKWGVPYMENSKFIRNLFMKYGKNPYLGMIIGMLATMLIHSSSATVGFTIVLFNSGFIGLNAAIGFILGDNIGTCFTALLASVGASLNAKRTAWAHIIYNLIGSLVILAVITPFSYLALKFTSMLGQDKFRLIANSHTLFNVISALVFLPFTKYYEKFINFIIR